MSREIYIKNRQVFKKPLSINDIIGDELITLALLDGCGRLTDNIEEAQSRILFDSNCIGRGVKLVECDRKNVMFSLNVPATREDIRLLYTLTRRVAGLWKATEVEVGIETVNVNELAACEDRDIDESISILANADTYYKDGSASLLCATLPICLTNGQMKAFSREYGEFSRLLHEKQAIGAFFSIPISSKDGSDVRTIYPVLRNEDFILPIEPCKNAFVGLAQADGKTSLMGFADFISKLPPEKKSVFDCSHLLISELDNEEIDNLF